VIYTSDKMEKDALLQTAARMCAAARTAPKTRGIDQIRTLVLTGEDKDDIARRMEEFGKREFGEGKDAWYRRDAANVRAAQAIVLVGAEKKPRGVQHCGFCGFHDCAECRKAGGNCAFTYVDLGIALSSAVATASIDRVDSRIMFSVGKAAEESDFSDGCLWLGIPVSVSGKSIFFDRKAPDEK
jgi:uncharacterized ferredoxin-like protein